MLELKAGTEVITATTPSGRAGSVAASAVAGGLAVPLHVAATPLCCCRRRTVCCARSRRVALVMPAAARADGRARRNDATRASCRLDGPRIAVGLFFLAVMRLVIEPVVPAIASRMVAAGALPVWRRVAIIYVAAVGEELIFRLFLLSAVAGVAARLLRLPHNLPTPAVIWTANGLSALLFAGVTCLRGVERCPWAWRCRCRC